MVHGFATDDGLAALAMAEALSCAVRGEVGPGAVEEILRFAEHDEAILVEAHRRCLAFGELDRSTRQTAARLLEQARHDVVAEEVRPRPAGDRQDGAVAPSWPGPAT